MARTLTVMFVIAMLVQGGCWESNDPEAVSSLAPCGFWEGPCDDPGEFCDYPENTCSAADESGACKLRPTACDDVFAPVQGCDGETYGNACLAQAAGTDQAGDAIGARHAPR